MSSPSASPTNRVATQVGTVLVAALAMMSCDARSVPPENSANPLTSATGVERTVKFSAYLYVPQTASDKKILQLVQYQVRTAFGPLKQARVSADDRELRHNVDAATFTKEAVTVIPTDATQPTQLAYRVTYPYEARVVVDTDIADKQTLSFTLLSPNYLTFKEEIFRDCVANYEHDREFSNSFWYVWYPNRPTCKHLIETEATAIEASQVGLNSGEISELEFNRRYYPVTAQLVDESTPPPTTYPEYDRLFGVNDPSKTSLSVYAIVGQADYDSYPTTRGYKVDMGLVEFINYLQKLRTQFGTKLTLEANAALDPFKFEYDGKLYNASISRYYDWIVLDEKFPENIKGTAMRGKFVAAILDHLKLSWFTLTAPLTVKSATGTKQLTIEFRNIYGVENGAKKYFVEAFKAGDIVLYNGHSYIGSGPLDPYNYDQSSFKNGYQIFFFNSCISFNYYGINYFDQKSGGSLDLDLVTNGMTVAIRDGGISTGQFIVALLDGSLGSWLEVLTSTQSKIDRTVRNDPIRVVDGELDNVFNPQTTPLDVQTGW